MRRLLPLLEPGFAFTAHTRTVADLLGRQVLSEIVETRILVPANRADWYPCTRGRRGCRRAVEPAPPPSPQPFVALCNTSDADCPNEHLDAAELEQYALDPHRFLELLTKRFDVTRPAFEQESTSTMRLGSNGAADVYFCFAPSEPRFTMWLHLLEARGRRAMVLVPTARHVDVSTARSHDERGLVHVVFLEDALSVEDLNLISEEPPTERTPGSGGPLVAPPGTEWPGTAVYMENYELVRFRYGTLPPVPCGPADLNLLNARTRKANVQWELFMAICEGNGRCTLEASGVSDMDALNTQTHRLAYALKKHTGIRGNPFRVSRTDRDVCARFRAYSVSERKVRQEERRDAFVNISRAALPKS